MIRTRRPWRHLALAVALTCAAAGPCVGAVAGATDEAEALSSKAEALYEQGRYADAIPLAIRALALTERELGKTHPDTAERLTDLADLYQQTQNFDEAIRLNERALAIRKAAGSEGRDTAESLRKLASIYDTTGAYDKAVALYKRSMAILDKTGGGADRDMADNLIGLALVYRNMGDLNQAIPLSRRALEINQNFHDAEPREIAVSLNNLAGMLDEAGDYAQAEPLYKRALEIDTRVLGRKHEATATDLSNLGLLYYNTGAFDQAALMLEEALKIRKDALGLRHTDTADSMTNLAALYEAKGDYPSAKQYAEKAQEIREKVLGKGHPDTASGLTLLGDLYFLTGDHDAAVPRYVRALAIREKALGPNHPDLATSLSRLAMMYTAAEEFAQAESTYKRVLTIQENSLGREHPDVAESLTGLSMFYWGRGDLARALPAAVRAREIEEINIGRMVQTATEERRRQYIATLSHDRDVSFSLASPTPGARTLGASAVLQLKGRVLDATADAQTRLRHHLDEPGRKLLAQLQKVVAQRGKLSLAGPDTSGPEARKQELDTLAQEQTQLEADLASRSAEFKQAILPVTLQRVQAALGPKDVLIEWTRFEPWRPKSQGGQLEVSAHRYAAYLITHDQPPAVVDLGPAEAIEQTAQRLQRQLQARQGDTRPSEASALYQLVMKPLLGLLAKMRPQPDQVLLAPDGALNLVPMAALVDEQNTFLGERFSLSYLASGRDLLRLQEAIRPRSGVMVVANPDYNQAGRTLAPGAAVADASGSRRGPSIAPSQRAAAMDRAGAVMSFSPLSGTEREARLLQDIYSLPAAAVATGAAATEARLKQVSGPAILHIATHGFFLQDLPQAGPKAGEKSALQAKLQQMPAPDSMVSGHKKKVRGIENEGSEVSAPQPHVRQGLGENPLLRSGLALAGANLRRSDGGEDGILTAAEVAQLDLQGTQLVVLSACETGTGDVANGEGVYGLRRALVLAGAQSQLVSLWKVDDAATAQLMGEYYTQLKSGKGRADALRLAQAKLRNNPATAHPYYWAPFIPVGEWRPLALAANAAAAR